MSDILIPNFGESITTATVAAWHKNAGDPVAKGDTLVTLETDKVSTDLEADESGVLEILVPEGAEAPIGAALGRISSSRTGKGRGSRTAGTGENHSAGNTGGTRFHPPSSCGRIPGTKAGKGNARPGTASRREKREV